MEKRAGVWIVLVMFCTGINRIDKKVVQVKFIEILECVGCI